MRILVVEDEPTLATQLDEGIQSVGYVVDVAHNGVDGHFMGETEPYDAIVLDIGLPQMDGIELVRQLGDLVDLQQIPVVFLTGHLQPERLQELRQLGVRQVLNKPFDPLQLASQLQQVWEAEHG